MGIVVGKCYDRHRHDDALQLAARIREMEGEIGRLRMMREREAREGEEREEGWRRERRRHREEAAGMRRLAREEGERARRLEAEAAARMESECKEWQHWLGAECLVEHLKEEQASREAAVDKWKHLYLSIKHELDALLLRSHPGGGFDVGVVGRLQAEAMEKDEMIEGLQARLSLMEKERVKREREVDILRQSLRILNTAGKRSGLRRSLHKRWL